MSYVLFLPVFFAVAELFERRIPSARRSVAAIAFCGLQLGTSLLGVFLDPGKSHFRTTDLLKAVRGFLGV
jgi:hypothetical protein